MTRYETPDVFEPGDDEGEPGVSYQCLIAISADSLQTLRACDVYRVLSEAPARARQGLADWIVAGRPDLVARVAEALADL